MKKEERRAKNPVSSEWKRQSRKEQRKEFTKNWRVLPSTDKPFSKAIVKKAFK